MKSKQRNGHLPTPPLVCHCSLPLDSTFNILHLTFSAAGHATQLRG
jgi:hypothetical protein